MKIIIENHYNRKIYQELQHDIGIAIPKEGDGILFEDKDTNRNLNVGKVICIVYNYASMQILISVKPHN